MVAFSNSDYVDNLLAILFSVIGSVFFYIIRTNLFQHASEYSEMVRYEKMIDKLDNNMSTGLSAGYYVNFVKQVFDILVQNNFVITNEVDKQQYNVKGLLCFLNLNDPKLIENFESVFDHKKVLSQNYTLTKLEVKTSKRNFICDLIKYNDEYYIFDIPTPIAVLVKMKTMLKNNDVE